MKPRTAALLAIALCGTASGADPLERLEQAYADAGDALLVALAWLPETREAARSLLPGIEAWYGGEEGRWLGIAEEARRKFFEALAGRWRGRGEAAFETVLGRARLWKELSAQLAAVHGAVAGPEEFAESVHAVEALRPVFDEVLANRPPDFDPALLGATLSSAEFAALPPDLLLLLMAMPERRRAGALRRLFAVAGLPDPGGNGGRGGKEPLWMKGREGATFPSRWRPGNTI